MIIRIVARFALAAALTHGTAAFAGGPVTVPDAQAPAAARDTGSRFYADIYGGVNWSGDNTLDALVSEGDPVPERTFLLGYDEGIVGGVRLGYRFNDHLRTDLEYAQRRNELDSLEIEGSGPGATPYSLTFDTRALMINAYYDFAPIRGFTPYVGAGVGKASVKTAGSLDPADPGYSYDSRQNATAAQLRLGTTYSLTETLDLGAEYTHFRAFGIDENISEDFFDTLQDDYKSDSVSVLLRVNF